MQEEICRNFKFTNIDLAIVIGTAGEWEDEIQKEGVGIILYDVITD